MLRVFWSDNTESCPPSSITLSKDESRHLVSVRRAKQGDSIEALNGFGWKGVGQLKSANPKEAQVDAIDWRFFENDKPALHLYPAMTKSSTLELLIQKATELGVHSIQPLITEHSEGIRDSGKFEKKIDRWRNLTIEAIKQCGNSHLPRISVPKNFSDALNEENEAKRIVFALTEDARAWSDFRKVISAGNKLDSFGLFLGPEGDFSVAEYSSFREAEAYFVSLGNNVLRMETAGIAGIALVKSLFL